jgi:hypothetical protein
MVEPDPTPTHNTRKLAAASAAVMGSPAVLNIEMLTAIAAKLFEHSDNIKSVPWQDIALNLRLAARLAEKFASLRFRVAEIAEMALRQDPGASARDLRDALADAEF